MLDEKNLGWISAPIIYQHLLE